MSDDHERLYEDVEWAKDRFHAIETTADDVLDFLDELAQATGDADLDLDLDQRANIELARDGVEEIQRRAERGHRELPETPRGGDDA